MILKFSEKEFDNSKSKDLIPLVCKKCENVFYKPKHRVQEAKSGKGNPYDFCCKECYSIYRTKEKIKIQCKGCGKDFDRNIYRIKSNKNNFCSNTCSAKFNNSNKKTGTRRSKIEKWIESMLIKKYSDLEFNFNNKEIINLELDIYVPKLMVAFEINGIHHYKPIHGIDKFNKIKKTDESKLEICNKKNIKLYVINISDQIRFEEKTSEGYFRIISDIIDSFSLERIMIS